MNLQQLRCVLEIARVGSVTKAAQNLYISQPNLSRTIKELEKELGVSLFRRGAQGMEPTVEAAQLLRYAETILRQVGELESIYRTHEQTMRLALAGPHSGYITRALAAFLAKQQGRPLNVSYQESATAQALDAVSRGQVQIAVVRYQLLYDDYFKELFAKAGLASRTLLRFTPCVLMAPGHPLAGQGTLQYDQLQQYPQILRGMPSWRSRRNLRLRHRNRRAVFMCRIGQVCMSCCGAYRAAMPGQIRFRRRNAAATALCSSAAPVWQ